MILNIGNTEQLYIEFVPWNPPRTITNDIIIDHILISYALYNSIIIS